VRRYSIAEAGQQLASIVHAVERGPAVEVTRRGKPVAVLVPLAQYRRLALAQRSFKDALRAFRSSHDLKALSLADKTFSDVRSQSSGRSPIW
jgi:prevent-host-death family protein